MNNLFKAVLLLCLGVLAASCSADSNKSPSKNNKVKAKAETVDQIRTRLEIEANETYRECPYSMLSKDYFSRFSRDPKAICQADEILIDSTWRILVSNEASDLTQRMAKHLKEFLNDRMGVDLEIKALAEHTPKKAKSIVLIETGGGVSDVKESFTIDVSKAGITVQGRDREGLRDGIVRLVQRIGLKQSPILQLDEAVYRPRLRTRLGAIPWMGSSKDVVFMGYNAVLAKSASLHALSTSDAIAELKGRQKPQTLAKLAETAKSADKYGLKSYILVETRKKFPKDDPVFNAYPDIQGALTWSEDGEYILCTEHPLVKQYLTESVQGIFRAVPELDGLQCIIGGEGFYHCYMRSFGTEKGHTNCPRCEPLGAAAVVSNLCNLLAQAARQVNPDAEIVVWPYSASYVWSDRYQTEFIKKLKPGVVFFTEIEKDEFVEKQDGVRKHIWDYSIDLIGPGERAKRQIELCKAAGVSIYMKSEPELAFEAPRLPQIPCMDRWADRAEALASCGADGAWVFPAFRQCYGASTTEVNQFFWWEPVGDREEILSCFAKRIAGQNAGPHLRNAWKYVSEAIAWSPEIPAYYRGPYYLGPAHPMCADPKADLPRGFYGYYLYMEEATDAEGLKIRPTFVKSPTGNIPVFGMFYRKMETYLKQAVEEIETADPLVPQRRRVTFDAEAWPTRWFYHTARTEANFYESCQLRDAILAFAKEPSKSEDEIVKHKHLFERWRNVLIDERQNAKQALKVAQADMRLDFYYGMDHTFPHVTDMIRAKLKIIDSEINEFLPSVKRQCGLN